MDRSLSLSLSRSSRALTASSLQSSSTSFSATSAKGGRRKEEVSDVVGQRVSSSPAPASLLPAKPSSSPRQGTGRSVGQVQS